MKASLIIPSRGGAARLPRLLASLGEQNYPNWEAIVVIDGDIDDSAAVVASYSQLPIRTIVFEQNRGRVAALNAGFAAATGDIFIRCDDDFELSPGHIAAHIAPHRQQTCGVVGLPVNIAPANAYFRAYGKAADELGRQSARATDPQQRWRLWGGNVSCDRDSFVKLGGYDTRYQGYGWEDLDFGYRLHQLGVPIQLTEDANVRHYLAATNTRLRTKRAFESGKARQLFESIHGLGSSAPAESAPETNWNRLVNAVAARLTEDRLQRASKLVDGAIKALPIPLARKAVALLVEAASIAGFRQGRKEPTNASC